MFYYVNAAAMIDVMLLMKVLLSLAGIAALVFLALVFYKVYQLLTGVGEIVKDMKQPLQETLEGVPALMDHVTIITENVADITDVVALNSEEVLHDVTEITAVAQKLVTAVGRLGTDITELLVRLLHVFSRDAASVRRRSDGEGSFSKLMSSVGTVLGILRRIHRHKAAKEKK